MAGTSTYVTRSKYTTVSGEVREYTSHRRVRSVQRIKITDDDCRALFVGLRAGESVKDVAAARRVARTTLAAAALIYAAKVLNLEPQPAVADAAA